MKPIAGASWHLPRSIFSLVGKKSHSKVTSVDTPTVPSRCNVYFERKRNLIQTQIAFECFLTMHIALCSITFGFVCERDRNAFKVYVAPGRYCMFQYLLVKTTYKLELQQLCKSFMQRLHPSNWQILNFTTCKPVLSHHYSHAAVLFFTDLQLEQNWCLHHTVAC